MPTTEDTRNEDQETFTVALSGPASATLKADAKTATGTINDDDALPVLSIAGATVDEGDTAQFVVTLAPASGKQVTVSYSTADGTAKASENDYTAASSTTLTFAAGDTTKTISVPTTEDTRDEDQETFTVTLSGPTNATLKSDAKTATGTINDDDDLPVLSIAGATVDEGDTAQFVVTLAPRQRQAGHRELFNGRRNGQGTGGLHGSVEHDADLRCGRHDEDHLGGDDRRHPQRGPGSLHGDPERVDERYAEVRRQDGHRHHQRRRRRPAGAVHRARDARGRG